MEPGRTIVTYTAYGRECVRPIGASWKGPSESPYADTQKAVKVKDEKFKELQDLYPIEAERLMGLEPNSTAGNGVTAKQFPFFFLHFSAFLAPLSGGFSTRCASTVGPLLNFLSGVGDVPIGKR